MASDSDKKTAKRTGSPSNGKSTSVRKKSVADGPKVNGYSVDFADAPDLNVSFETYQPGEYAHKQLGLSEAQVMAMYRSMLLQRRFEERAAQMYGKQKIGGFLHLYIGQEAIATGTAFAMRIGQDQVITAYRDHGLGLALGMDTNACMAELFGKIGGCSRGKGGSMHYFSAELKMMGGHGIVGAHIPVGTGIAFANKYKGEDTVCLTFFGDGAVHQGAFHEAANLAGLYGLPVIYVIENNHYAMGTAVHRAAAEPDLYKQGLSYNIPSSLVNGMDVFAVYKAMQDHIAMARKGQPSLLEIRTYRYRGHSMSDPQKYRTKEEMDAKKNEDPIIRLKSYMIEHKLATNEVLDAVDEEVNNEVLASVEFAENSPFPGLETIYEDIYTQQDYPFTT
ncbi:MAG: pyruvate dehydrogenase (acetyl-transferring) E1 component subunit alpha [Rhodothermales bacterium]|nr:pyruvate dehydrogenase (acetyl-transferring) E1 component subunit alpha [Rhodothermales bacterium]